MLALVVATLMSAAAPDEEVVWGPAAYFGVAAGLSATTSVLMAVPEAALALVSATAATFFAISAAPIVAGFGLVRLDPERSAVPIFGAVVGDVVGAVTGGVAGALLLGPRLSSSVPSFVAPEQRDFVSYGAGALAGAWLLRALGCGAGAAVGRGISLSLDGGGQAPALQLET